MRCPQCELDNAEGALYCARCHSALPRPLAPGECPFCGRLPELDEEPQAVCPSCGNDAQRGTQVRERRLAALRAEVAQERQAFESKASPAQRHGCLPLLIALGMLLITLWVIRLS